MTKEQAVVYLRFSGFSEEQIKAIERAFSGWGKVCPSAGIDCEDCPAYEDTISRKAVMEICNEEWDSDLIVERIGQLPSVSSSQKPKSEWQQDHEILKAYSDGANAVLDMIRAEIAELEEGILSYHNDRPWVFKDEVLQIIDKYKAEGSEE